MARLNYLDNLKVSLTFLVIFHHAGQAYGDGGEWGYAPSMLCKNVYLNIFSSLGTKGIRFQKSRYTNHYYKQKKNEHINCIIICHLYSVGI